MGWGVVYLSVRLRIYPWFMRLCIVFLKNARGILLGVYVLELPIDCCSDRWIPLRSRNAFHTARGISAAGDLDKIIISHSLLLGFIIILLPKVNVLTAGIRPGERCI